MKIFIICGSLLLALTVLSGAFGAHILKEKISIDYLRIYEKGIQYQAYHSIALILIGSDSRLGSTSVCKSKSRPSILNFVP